MTKKWLILPFIPVALISMIILLPSCGGEITDDPEILARLPRKVDYNYHIRPLLSDRCYACHGPDDNTREAGLRLDIEEEAKKTLAESGKRAIVNGSINHSEVMERIRSTDPEIAMPPPESNLELNEYEKALIAKWIDQGAKWKPHWAFIPPTQPAVPKVKNKEWVRNPIDHFVLNRLEREKIEPSPEADKERLLRRVTLDLTGLPPTVEEMDAFLADDAPDAYEKVVDRLLETNAYAERMTTEWLDVARYADSHGLHADGYRLMWPWRDWVIKAFNENMPFDRFVTWQLAGDLLSNATTEQKLATAFHRNHPMTAEGGVVDEEWRLEYVFDRTNTTSRAFLGMTMECARCHDHKFDPISQKEYYQMAAFFNNIKELGMTGDDGNYGPSLMLPDETTAEKIKRVEHKIDSLENLLTVTEEQTRKLGKYLEEKAKPSPFTKAFFRYPLDKISHTGGKSFADNNPKARVSGEAKLVDGKKGKALKIDNEYDLLHLEGVGNFEVNEEFSAGAWIFPETDKKIMSIMGTAGDKNNFWRGWTFELDQEGHLEARLIHSLPHNYIHVRSEETIPKDTWTHVMFTYDGLSKAEGLNLYINGLPAKKVVAYDQLYKSIKTIQSGDHKQVDRAIRIGKAYRSFTGENGIYEGLIDEITLFQRNLTALEIANLAGVEDKSQISGEEKLRHYLTRQNTEYRETRKEITNLMDELLQMRDSVDEVMVMEEMPEPRAMFVLNRGVYNAPGEQVDPNIPLKLGEFPSDLPKNRLGLAQWLLSPEHPTTARVTVNRYWQMYFGQGLVNTPEDFGSQGTLPTHPELLDWLATTFIHSGWDVKAMQKLIVTSATYRQSSKNREELAEIDPYNDLLARGPKHRLSAEMIRDNALAASGLLVRKTGGPSVKPYQPEGLWIDKGSFSHVLLHYVPGTGEDLYRRSMYTFIRRTSPPPSMVAFDASGRNECMVRRQNTNTPMQALILLNDPQYVEAARMMGERMIKEGGKSLEDRIQYGFRLVAGRKLRDREIQVFKQLYEDELAKFQADADAAKSLMEVGEMARDTNLDLAEGAAMGMVASMMINHDEAYTKR